MNNYVFGRKVCLELIETNAKDILNIFVSDKLLKQLPDLQIVPQVKSISFLNKLSEDQNHQGIVIELKTFNYTNFDDQKILQYPKILMLDHIQDPANFGAIIRSAECFDVKLIMIPKDRSVKVNGTVYKTSMGAIKNINIMQVTNLNVAITKLKKLGYWIYGTSLSTKTTLDKCQFADKSVIIIGNENKGITNNIAKNCDQLVKINMHGKINSLNASVATGIILYELTKGE
jgi:23S rRNA (guanosine2251-2'-O)-methyltransferase